MTQDLRDAICRTGRSLYGRRLVHGTAGNISVRLPDDAGFLITPSDACLGALEPDRLAWIDLEGRQRSGDRASKTLALHRRIYDSVPDANCVLHTHSSSLVELTLKGVWSDDDVVPPITPYQVMKVGHVPLVRYRRPGDPAVADAIARLIASHSTRGLPLRAVLCERLGPQVWHASLDAATALLEELEETARLWLSLDRQGDPLDADAIAELRRQFNAPW